MGLNNKILIFILVFFLYILLVNGQEVEPISGFEDKTVIWLSDLNELDGEIIVNIAIADNNAEGDGDGGKIRFEGASIISVEKVDWEENCRDNDKFQYECINSDETNFQWFNFAFAEQDYLKVKVKFDGDAYLILEETGGMECGAYFQTAQVGPYLGYPDRSGGLPCTAQKTYIGNKKVSDIGGFPVRVKLDNSIVVESDSIEISSNNNFNLLILFISLIVIIGIFVYLGKIRKNMK